MKKKHYTRVGDQVCLILYVESDNYGLHVNKLINSVIIMRLTTALRHRYLYHYYKMIAI